VWPHVLTSLEALSGDSSGNERNLWRVCCLGSGREGSGCVGLISCMLIPSFPLCIPEGKLTSCWGG
jgi:hypothetical protein